MHYKIKDILVFIRKYDDSGLFATKSNTKLRKHIRACLEKDSLCFFRDKTGLIGFVEWYHIKNCQYLVTQVRAHRFLNSNPTGKLLWVQNSVFKPNTLTMRIFRRFIKEHPTTKQILWFKHKTKKFTTFKI